MENIKTDEQLMNEMIKKVDLKKCKKLYAMSFHLHDSDIQGFEQLIKEWARQKVHLYKLLGEKLKIEKQLDFDREEISKTLTDGDRILADNNTESDWYQFIDNVTEEVPIFSRVMNGAFSYSRILADFPNVTRQAVTGYEHVFNFKNNEEKIPLSKIIHKLFNNEKIDIALSKFIQSHSSKIIGNMYISIDPFDYLTMSMNKSNWSSCHSLHKSINEDYISYGEYSAGIFSYMCDNVSMIAYRTNGEEVKFSWFNRSFMAESKNWRQMIYMNTDFESFVNSRQYPFDSEFLCKIIREMLEQLIDKKQETQETSVNMHTNSRTWKVSRNCDRNQEKIEDNGCPSLHYNDPLNGWTYTFTYSKPYDNLKPIRVGSYPNCPICGKNEMEHSDEPFCYRCKLEFNIPD